MFKRRTSKVDRKQHIQLQARVVSPRIVWFSFVKACSKGMWLIVALAVLGVAIWGGRVALQRWVFKNPEFRLQVIQLTPNTAIDEERLVQVAHIDINGTLFDCHLSAIEKTLRAMPEISSAQVKREFPGTLIVKVVARQPVVWVSCPLAADPVLPRDPESGLLVDASGIAYPCPPGQLDAAMNLPVIEVGADVAGAQPLAAGQKVVNAEFDRAMALRGVAAAASPDAMGWIDTIRQSRVWSLEVVGRDGMQATFGLGDHERQMQDLLTAIGHARSTNQPIASINLIPRNCLPMYLRDENLPKTVSLTEDPAPASAPVLVHPKDNPAQGRREADLKQLINRH